MKSHWEAIRSDQEQPCAVCFWHAYHASASLPTYSCAHNAFMAIALCIGRPTAGTGASRQDHCFDYLPLGHQAPLRIECTPEHR
jgi:hypothetical protein